MTGKDYKALLYRTNDDGHFLLNQGWAGSIEHVNDKKTKFAAVLCKFNDLDLGSSGKQWWVSISTYDDDIIIKKDDNLVIADMYMREYTVHFKVISIHKID